MTHPTSPAARLARAGVLGSVSLALAVGAHLLGGGALPSATVLGALALGLAAASVPLTARRLRMPALVAILGVEQVGLHLALGLAASTTPACAAGHHALTTPLTTCAMPTAGHLVAPDAAMLAAHVVAVVLTAWLLARGEAWLWQLGSVAYARATARPTRRRALPVRVVARGPWSPVLSPALARVRLRGPPQR